MPNEQITIERTYGASVEEIWELWTTPAGIESWWAPKVMTLDAMHDEEWTQRLVMGRENELSNLARVIERRREGTRNGRSPR
jgi:uncharacterized protein YndB with AHSA1/START domain